MLESEQFSCPACQSRVVRRSRRKGLLQSFFYSWFGLYPWVCRECKHRFMLRSRKDTTLHVPEHGHGAS